MLFRYHLYTLAEVKHELSVLLIILHLELLEWASDRRTKIHVGEDTRGLTHIVLVPSVGCKETTLLLTVGNGKADVTLIQGKCFLAPVRICTNVSLIY